MSTVGGSLLSLANSHTQMEFLSGAQVSQKVGRNMQTDCEIYTFSFESSKGEKNACYASENPEQMTDSEFEIDPDKSEYDSWRTWINAFLADPFVVKK
jgi:hypothetical protein